MTQKKEQEATFSFDNIDSEYELIDRLRIRFQMYGEGIDHLFGFIVGFSIAKQIDLQKTFLQDFTEYLSKKYEYNLYAVSWTDYIKSISDEKGYEIPKFYELLDEFRNTKIEEIGLVNLSWEQRDYDFNRRIKNINIDYPVLPLKPPHKLKAVRIPNVKVHAFYYDECDSKYYEQCFNNYEQLKKWAKDCFNVTESEWAKC